MAVTRKSEIWRVVSEKVGSIEGFSSERDMESFLMNNPAVIGCWSPDPRGKQPLVKSQVISRPDKSNWGRMDIVGIANKEDGGFELRIFELKLENIDVSAVEQLASYLESWNKQEGPKDQIRKWALDLGIPGLDESSVDEIIDEPAGVLVGPKFSAEAIKRALEIGPCIQGLRVARFRGGSKSEYYIIVEDQIGIVSGRRYWSWQELIDAGLIERTDTFFISNKGYKLSGKPDPAYLKYNWIRILFDDASKEIILSREQQIIEDARNKRDAYAERWIPKALGAIRSGKSIVLTNATGLSYFAFGGPSTYWVPTDWWIHERSNKTLTQLKNELFKR